MRTETERETESGRTELERLETSSGSEIGHGFLAETVRETLSLPARGESPREVTWRSGSEIGCGWPDDAADQASPTRWKRSRSDLHFALPSAEEAQCG